MADARTPQEVMADVLGVSRNGALMADLMSRLGAEGFVIVACPVGERRVVDRTPQPCPECNGSGEQHVEHLVTGEPFTEDCEGCGGRGTVDSDRVLAVEALRWRWEDGRARRRWATTKHAC